MFYRCSILALTKTSSIEVKHYINTRALFYVKYYVAMFNKLREFNLIILVIRIHLYASDANLSSDD